MPPILKFLLEFGPLLVFFGAYIGYDYDMFIATKYLMAFSLISLAITYYYNKTIPKTLLYSTLTLLILGSITILTKNSSFIKMKPTILYLILACVLFAGLYYNRIFLKSILGKEFNLSEKAWIALSKRWGYFFVFLALLNEIIWRNFSEIFWVKFKVFGIIPILIIFTIMQIPFITKNNKEQKSL